MKKDRTEAMRGLAQTPDRACGGSAHSTMQAETSMTGYLYTGDPAKLATWLSPRPRPQDQGSQWCNSQPKPSKARGPRTWGRPLVQVWHHKAYSSDVQWSWDFPNFHMSQLRKRQEIASLFHSGPSCPHQGCSVPIQPAYAHASLLWNTSQPPRDEA